MHVDNCCKFCQALFKYLLHALFYCPKIKEWWPPFLAFMRHASTNLSFLELVIWVKSRGVVEEFERFFVIAWSLWERRNKKLYEKKKESPSSTIERALAYYSLFVDCSDSLRRDLKKLSHWQPPPISYYKLNVGAALFFDNQAAGIGAILRDSNII